MILYVFLAYIFPPLATHKHLAQGMMKEIFHYMYYKAFSEIHIFNNSMQIFKKGVPHSYKIAIQNMTRAEKKTTKKLSNLYLTILLLLKCMV